MVAYASLTLGSLESHDDDTIIGRLLESDSVSGFTQVSHLQIQAWKGQLEILRSAAKELIRAFPRLSSAALVLEYRIPRREKRIDAVILFSDTVVVLEFKVGAGAILPEDKVQVLDYSLDLAYYHYESSGRRIVPLLCPTRLQGVRKESIGIGAIVDDLVVCGGDDLPGLLASIATEDAEKEKVPIDGMQWTKSRYQPIPGIIEASTKLFSNHSIEDINKTLASSDSIDRSIEYTHCVIRKAQDSERKVLCLLTGVPGAGKTLTGLRLAHLEAAAESNWRSVFMSGNGPLLKVLRAALTNDYAARQGISKVAAKLHADASIHSVHSYLNETRQHELPPTEQIVIFDEAQRAWDASKMVKMANKARQASETTGRQISPELSARSEPWQILSVLDRHAGGAVIVALCGNGQEIHDGEAGVAEWISARDEGFPHWKLVCSPTAAALSQISAGHPETRIVPEMHLDVPLRAHRAAKHSLWVDAVLSGKPEEAHRYVEQSSFPILLTSDLEMARDWLTSTTLGSRRCGILASSGGVRLRPYGIEVSADFRKSVDYAKWFTGPRGDIRSSYALEVAATEFECQGLELDRVGVAWSWDLLAKGSRVTARAFRGSQWKSIQGDREREYALNKYRVLLTRAREGMVIWVPKGRTEDSTRSPREMEDLRSYLVDCGAVVL